MIIHKDSQHSAQSRGGGLDAAAYANGERPELTREERTEIREMLMGEDALRFQADACRVLGPEAGIMLRELVFWSDKGSKPDGWIYKTEDDLLKAGLTRH